MATLYVDDKPYEVVPGRNLLETCLGLGFDLPYFCWHPALGSVGACRQCAVKVFRNEEDRKGKLMMSCMEPVSDNQRISINDPEAKEFRAAVIEWLMTNHPHDCAVCDEGGSCHLQDMTVMTGHDYRRFEYRKRTYQNQNLGPFLNHEMNRCIQCYRCVRFYRDYAGGDDLDVFASKNHVYFGRHEDGVLENEFSGNLAEVCPTGVFTDKTLKQHYTRKWDLTMAPSICQHCSLGCNTIAGERYGGLRLITSRYHADVNGYFLCDRGRFGYEFTNAPDRIRQPMIQNEAADATRVVREVSDILRNHRVIGIGSPRASLQSNFALKALVGEDNFYHGVSVDEHNLAELIIRILREGPVRMPPMREVEKADAVFILGEDLTNTAPMMALAVRQAVRQMPLENIGKASVPPWHDAAAREIVQEQRGPLFVASTTTTKLHDVATATFHGAPDDIARLGYAVAHLLNPALPEVPLKGEAATLAQQIAEALTAAKRPVIISGMSCDCATVIKAAANVAWALHQKNSATGLVFALPECNSMGLAMMGGHRLNSAFNAVINDHADAVIVMENDLYRHAYNHVVDKFLDKCKHVIVIDHSPSPTAAKAHIVIPAGTFAESDGTLVNNEGRAQRFFQVHECSPSIQESWRWLLQVASNIDHDPVSRWRNFHDISKAISSSEPLLKGIDALTPPPDFRIAGQKIPRQPHRYSGRTAMEAHIAVSEPKPPDDPDSALTYTMEGYRGMPPPSTIPFYWAPGWNSVQAVNKYQEEPGGRLRGGDPGLRLIEPVPDGREAPYFTDIPEIFIPLKDHLWLVSLHHIFGSEELSARGKAVATRVPANYVLVGTEDAKELSLSPGDLLSFEVNRQPYQLPVRISTAIPKGIAGMPYGLPGLPFVDLPAWAIIKTSTHE